MIVDELKRTVRAGYDVLGADFGAWTARIEGDPWQRYLDQLAARLPEGGRVLDLGCGDGSKIATLAERFELVAVDLSEEQLRLARDRLPEATFIHGDFTELQFPAESFDTITALYSVMHAPREAHPALFAQISRWLKPGGLFLASLSHVGGEDRIGEWLGVEMFFSSYDAETNRRLVGEAGLVVLEDELVWMKEPKGDIAFLWVLAQKPISE